MVRAYCCKLLGLEANLLKVIPAELGGGFGGKTVVYLEPVALALSRKAGRPVRMVMSREEVFRGTGPTSGSTIWVKIGAKKNGTITAADTEMKYSAGAFAGSPVQLGCMTGFAPYDLSNVRLVGMTWWSINQRRRHIEHLGGPWPLLLLRALWMISLINLDKRHRFFRCLC